MVEFIWPKEGIVIRTPWLLLIEFNRIWKNKIPKKRETDQTVSFVCDTHTTNSQMEMRREKQTNKAERITYKQTKAQINGWIFLYRNKCESFVQITKSQKHMSIFTLFVVTCILTPSFEASKQEKTHGATKSVPLLTYYLYAFVFTVFNALSFPCVVIYVKVKWRWQLRKVRLKMKLNAESNECFATLNRPPPIFHECKTQTVKIETFDLWPTSCCCYG